MQFILGNRYWCVLQTQVVNPDKAPKEFLYSMCEGELTAIGKQIVDSKVIYFAEVAGNRIRASHVFDNPTDCIAKAQEMRDELSAGSEIIDQTD